MSKPLTYGSVCSGIEAASVAWHPLGWRAAFVSEIEAFPRAVLQHRWPEIPLHGDFTTIQAGEYSPIDLLVGGTPCQSFSVAGLRGGLDDERGNLALEYLRLADRLRPRWLVWENVPGVLSSAGGRDFGSILGGLVELGYGFAYRVLDAQFFGVAQRRRRVFVVGHLGDWRRAAAVLFERHSLSGHPSPRREAGQRAARPIAAGSQRGSGYRNDADTADNLIAAFGGNDTRGPIDVATACNAHGREGGAMPEVGGDHVGSLRAASGGSSRDYVAFDLAQITSAANRTRVDAALPASTLNAKGDMHVAFNITPSNSNKDYNARPSDRAQAITSGGNRPSARGGDLIAGSAVRRLTPRECERLQGFPEVENTLRILVCKSEAEKRARARSAEGSSQLLAQEQSAPVAVHVLIDFERQHLQIHSLGRSPWSAAIAELESSFLPPMPGGAFARLVALTNSAVGHSTPAGRAASPANTKPSSRALSGSALALLSGHEIAELASDAERFTTALDACTRSITSPPGLTAQTFVSTLEILASCVAVAMTGFIPEAMRIACSYELRLTVHQGYTAIPWRGGMAPDGPRYKALGNSMAVPVMRWIGERIAQVEALQLASTSPHFNGEAA